MTPLLSHWLLAQVTPWEQLRLLREILRMMILELFPLMTSLLLKAKMLMLFSLLVLAILIPNLSASIILLLRLTLPPMLITQV